MGIDGINGGNNAFVIQKEYGIKVEEENLNINDSIMAVKNVRESRAEGKTKELLDKIIEENPDLKISDEIELDIIKSLLRGEDKVPMPKREELGEEGFDWHSEYSDMKINNFSDEDEVPSLAVINIDHVKGYRYSSTTMIFDYDNDGYADYCDMTFDNDKNFQKRLRIDLERKTCYSEVKEFHKDTQNS